MASPKTKAKAPSEGRIIAAADIGYSSVKAMIEGGSPIIMPSGAIPASLMHARFVDALDDGPVDVKGTLYYAGIEPDIADGYQRHAASRFALSPDYHALYLETLRRLGKEHIDVMVLGLPSCEFSTEVKAYLKETFVGEHRVGDRVFQVDSIKVADQPLGTGALISQTSGDSFLSDRILILDLGSGTADLALLIRGGVNRSVSTSFRQSMRYIVEAVAQEISTPECRVTPAYIDEKLRAGLTSFEKNKTTIDLIEPIKAIADKLAPQIVSDIRGKIGDFAEIDRVIITGGGSLHLGKAIAALIKGKDVEMMPDPVTANLRGFIAMAASHG